MIGTIKRRIKSAYWLAVLYYLLTDLVSRFKFRLGDIDTESGTIHGTFSVSESVGYIERVVRDYRHYAGIARFYGRAAEVGPGDNCGVGMLLRHDGCDWVDLVDRFYSRRNMASQAAIYAALISSHAGLEAIVGGADLKDEGTFGFLRRHYGDGAAAENFFTTSKGYDFVVSRAVFEHLYDPILALDRMTAALNPGGYLMHKVDLRDHGMFSGAHQELTFLEVPKWLYRWMTTGTGRPNRVLVDSYRSALQALSLDAKLLVTRLAGVGDIDPHLEYNAIPEQTRARSIAYVKSVRGRFASCFREVSDADLSVTGVFLVARKVG
jgi:hypothetical protein